MFVDVLKGEEKKVLHSVYDANRPSVFVHPQQPLFVFRYSDAHYTVNFKLINWESGVEVALKNLLSIDASAPTCWSRCEPRATWRHWRNSPTIGQWLFGSALESTSCKTNLGFSHRNAHALYPAAIRNSGRGAGPRYREPFSPVGFSNQFRAVAILP